MNNTMFQLNDYSKLKVIGELPENVSCSKNTFQLTQAITGVIITAYNTAVVLEHAREVLRSHK